MKHFTLAAIVASIPFVTSFIAAEAWQADHSIHEQAAYSRQDTAAMEALIDRQDDILERGRRNATARAGRHYSQKEAAVLIARIWNVEVADAR